MRVDTRLDLREFATNCVKYLFDQRAIVFRMGRNIRTVSMPNPRGRNVYSERDRRVCFPIFYFFRGGDGASRDVGRGLHGRLDRQFDSGYAARVARIVWLTIGYSFSSMGSQRSAGSWTQCRPANQSDGKWFCMSASEDRVTARMAIGWRGFLRSGYGTGS